MVMPSLKSSDAESSTRTASFTPSKKSAPPYLPDVVLWVPPSSVPVLPDPDAS
jgi:hypothetical protein